jgi:PhnB protein
LSGRPSKKIARGVVIERYRSTYQQDGLGRLGTLEPGNASNRKEMPMQVQPYLFFDGRCEEAIEFYQKKLGADVKAMMRFKDSPAPHQPGMIPPGAENKIMHAALQIGETLVLASDGRATGKPKFEGFALTLNASSDAEGERLFGALSEGGQIQMPMAKTFFASRFGMVTDRLGVTWMVLVPAGNQ